MPLNKLDNFLKNVEGRILYVSPSDLDSTDSITNEGNSQTQPFKTLQRAILEAARFSYQKGNNNDLIEKTTILLMPGEHEIDNRPGYSIQSDGNNAQAISPDGTTFADASIFDLTLESNFDLTQEDNSLYKFNSIHGGVIVPRGTSIVGLDLRKTKIRPKYVPNPTDPAVPDSAIFRVTGGCYFWQFSMFDGDSASRVYTHHFNFTANNLVKPLFSHHKLTCFEYADGINRSARTGLTDLDMYYAKLSRAYNAASTRNIAEKYPISEDGFAKQRAEWEIVGAFADDPITISTIKAGTTPGVPTNEVTVTTSINHELTVGTPIKIRNVRPSAYNISTRVTTVDTTNPKRFTYTLPDYDDELQTPGDATQNAQLTIETDTVEGASPYIFNCSLRSVYGMQGMLADGSKADGFRSMVVAQFTGVSLQKDDRAFVKYITANRKYEGNDFSPVFGDNLALRSSSTNPATIYHLDSEAIYRKGWETAHVRIINDAILQIVSVFAIGYNKHFNAQSGGDASITNSNSNFGQLALVSEGFKREAFAKDDQAFITHIIPPKAINPIEQKLDWLSIDATKTKSVANNSRLYLHNYKSEFTKPPHITQGFRIGAKKDDKLYVLIDGVEYDASIYMVDFGGLATISSVKEYSVNPPVTNIFTVSNSGTHKLDNGEKVRILSNDGDLPENLEEETTYFVIRKSATQFSLAASLADSNENNAIDVYGGISLKVISRVTDKEPNNSRNDNIGHPIEWDSTQKQWFIHTKSNSTIYQNLPTDGYTEPTYFRRVEDDRSIDDKIYKLRIVVPKESVNSKNPENGFIIQESSSTGVRDDADFVKSDSLTNKDDYDFNRNPRYISSCTYSAPLVTVTCENPHNLQQHDSITIKQAKSTDNTVGTANSGYNGTFGVVSILDDMQFTYNPGRSIPTSLINDFNKSTAGAATGIPRFERTDLKSNLYVYRNEIFSEYDQQNNQNGIYHVYPLSADYKVPLEFTTYEYGQNVRDLYPQLDRDNVNDDPESSKSFAVRSPLGKVVTNDLQKSLTRESIDKFLTKTGIGITINTVTTNSTNAILTFNRNHGLSGLSSSFVRNGSIDYNDGTHYNVKVTTDSSNNIWNGTLATVVVSGGGISHHEITNPGSGWQVGDLGYFNEAQIGPSGSGGILQSAESGTTGFTRAQLGISKDLTIQVTGAGTTMSGHYRLLEVPTGNTVSIARTSGDPIITNKHYAFVVGPAIKINTTSTPTDTLTGISTITFTEANTRAHGLAVGNRFQLNDSNNNNLGNFIVKELDNSNPLTKFTAINYTGSNVGSLANGYVLKHGLSANDGVSAKNDENLDERGVPLFDKELAFVRNASDLSVDSTNLELQLYDWDGTGNQQGVLERFPYGSYIQIDDEIMRIKSPTFTSYDSVGNNYGTLQVLRGLFGTPSQIHVQNTLIKKIKPVAVEFHRPSILRASGHTFEYLGYGPGNYSTALPQVQVKRLSEREEFLSQSQERGGGAVVYTGMNDKGDFYIGNQKKSALTGEETTFDTPVPTVAGEIPGKLSVVFDEVTVKDRLVVEGGKSQTSLSQFDGPVNFNNEVKIKDPLKLKNEADSTATNEGALTVSGGVGIAKNLVMGGKLKVKDSNSTNSTSTTTGALTVDGGVGVGLNLNVGGDAAIGTNLDVTGTGTFGGSLDITGGITLSSDITSTGATLGNIQIGVTDDNLIDVVSDSDNITLRGHNTAGKGVYVQTGDGTTIAKFEKHSDSGKGHFELLGEDSDGNVVTKIINQTWGVEVKGGDLKVNSGDIVAFFTSDKNLKDNISPITKALSKVNSISGNTFNWNEKSTREGMLDTGVVAQEIEALGLPGVTTVRDDGTHAVNYEKLIPLLIEAIKELSNKVDALS